MEFCSKCGNMYYIMLSKNDSNKITYHCRKCGDENSKLINELKNFMYQKHILSIIIQIIKILLMNIQNMILHYQEQIN